MLWGKEGEILSKTYIDTKNGADQLPRRPGSTATGRGPQRQRTKKVSNRKNPPSDKDQPIFGEGYFQEENALHGTLAENLDR